VTTARRSSAIVVLMERIRGATVPRGERQVFVGSSRVRRYVVRSLALAFAMPPVLWAISLLLGMNGFASLPVHARLVAARPPAHVTAASTRQASVDFRADKRDRGRSTV